MVSFFACRTLDGGDATRAEDRREEELSGQESCLMQVEGIGRHRQELGLC